jgi:hypothetical protein
MWLNVMNYEQSLVLQLLYTFIAIVNYITGFVTLMYPRNVSSKIIMSAAPDVFNVLIKLIFSYCTKWIIAN